jgi:hypothetical protein
MVVVETCRGRELAAVHPREEREREVLEGEEGRGSAGLGPHEEREREGGVALGLGVSKGRGTMLLGV